MKKAISLLLLVLSWTLAGAQDTFYDMDSVQTIEIVFDSTNWDALLDANVATETYLLADSVVINGQVYRNAGVKYKGNSSYSPNRAKNPLHIKLDYLIKQDYQGYQDIKLGNGFSDPTMVREVSSYEVLRRYMDGPRCNYAKVSINGTYWGLYTNSEDIGNDFIEKHYYSSCGTFVKCNPQNAGPGTAGSSLLYISTDSAQYYSNYEMQSDFGWSDLIHLCDTLNNYSSTINSILDVDRALWMLAFNNVLVNLDSYSGAFRQNYYLYRNHANQWIPTVWDLNMSYGGFVMNGVTQLTLSGMQTMAPDLHINDTNWPLIKKLLADPMYKRMYLAHMRTINNENFLNQDYKTLITQLRQRIDSLVQTDIHFLYSYTQYQNSLTTATGTGMGSAAVYTLMDTRATWLSTNALLSSSPPTITNVVALPVTISYADSVLITANVINAGSNAVWLGYRDSKSDRFVRTPMFDDGLHGDSVAGDNVFGVAIVASSLKIQYYIYAENANAGVFSPERAEHEFYTLYPTIAMASAQDIVLNEVMATNNSIITNEDCKFKDWIELYNKSSQTLGLGDLFLSDDAANLLKWSFPRSAIISPGEHLLVWADDKDDIYLDIHTNFNLSSLGDEVYLSDSLGNIIDSVTFGAQINDVSFARCPDGTGAFALTATPTPRAANSCNPAGVGETMIVESVRIFPNPANLQVTVRSEVYLKSIELFDLSGRSVAQWADVQAGDFAIDLQHISAGLYTLRMNGAGTFRLAITK